MKTRGNGKSQEEIQENRNAFIDFSRNNAIARIENLIDAIDAGTFIFSVHLPRNAPDPFFVYVSITHEDGPQTYRSTMPINLAYPNSVMPAILADILSKAKSECSDNMN